VRATVFLPTPPLSAPTIIDGWLCHWRPPEKSVHVDTDNTLGGTMPEAGSAWDDSISIVRPPGAGLVSGRIAVAGRTRQETACGDDGSCHGPAAPDAGLPGASLHGPVAAGCSSPAPARLIRVAPIDQGSCPPAEFHDRPRCACSIGGWLAKRSENSSRGCVHAHFHDRRSCAPASSPRPSILRSAEIIASGFLVNSTEPASCEQFARARRARSGSPARAPRRPR